MGTFEYFCKKKRFLSFSKYYFRPILIREPAGDGVQLGDDIKFSSFLRIGFRVIVLLGIIVSVSIAQDYSNWSFGKKVTLNTTATGANVTGDVANFPIHIRLNSSNFNFSQAKSNGEDIRFAQNNGTPLSYHIERWETGSELADVWVKLPNVQGNNNTQSFLMFWGNSAATSIANAANVFETSNGFAGVWHLNEVGNDNANNYQDVTSNQNHCTGTSMVAGSRIEGRAGPAQLFDGTADYMTCGNNASVNITTNLTLSAWIRADLSNRNYTGIINKDRADNTGYWLMWSDQYGHILFESYSEGVYQKTPIPLATPELGTWIHVTGTFNGSVLAIYRDGILANTFNYQGVNGAFSSSAQPLRIGSALGYGDQFFAGAIDEVRISNTVRSANWIKLNYENQKNNQSLVVLDNSRPPAYLQYSEGTVQSYNMGQVIATNTLSYKGAVATSITISPALPAGLSINSTNGSITGTPTETALAGAYVVTVTNLDGAESITLNITVSGPPSNLAYSQGTNLVYALDSPITNNLLTFDNGPATNISIAPSLPSGLIFNTSNGTVSGTPSSRIDPADYTVTVTNSVGSSNIVLNVSVLEPPSNLTYSQGLSLNYISGISIPENILTYDGSEADSVTVTPALPAGLILNTSNGRITGVPDTSAASANYTVTVWNGVDSASLVLNITVQTAPGNLTYSRGSILSYVVNQPAVVNNLTYTGDLATQVTVDPPLPLGLTVNSVTGVVSGTPTVVSPLSLYVVTVSNAAGQDTIHVNVEVTPTVVAPFSLSYTGGNNYNFFLGDTVNTGSLIFSGTRDASLNISVSPNLPAGLTLNPLSGAIIGTPTTEVGFVVYTITVSNSGGSADLIVNIGVGNSPPRNLTYTFPSPLQYILSNPIPNNELSFLGGQDISVSISPPLPGGLSLETASGTISGNPTQLSAAQDYVVTVTNSSGAAQMILNIEVAATAVPPYDLGYSRGLNMSYVVGTPIQNNKLTFKGSPALSVSVNPSLPPGLIFNAFTGEISGNPTQVSARQPYKVILTNLLSSDSVVFNLEVTNAPVAPSSPVYSEGNLLGYALNEPVVPNLLSYNGTNATSIRVSPGLPTGLNFDSTNGTIWGTPTATSPNSEYDVTIQNSAGSIQFTISLGVGTAFSSVSAQVSKPAPNSVIGNFAVSYSLSAGVKSGTVSWTDGRDANGLVIPDSLNNQTAVLTGGALSAGTHENIALTGLNLMQGGTYLVLINFVDSMDIALSTIRIPLVRLSSSIRGLRLKPPSITLNLGESVSFQAAGLDVVLRGNVEDTSEVEVSPVQWVALGEAGNVNSEGVYTALSLGSGKVVATGAGYSDTSTVQVNGGVISLPAGGNQAVSIGTNLQLVLPDLPDLTTPSFTVSQILSANMPSGIQAVGPAVVNEPINFSSSVVYRMLLDTVASGNLSHARVYRVLQNGELLLVESTRVGNWFEFSVDTLGTYILGIDNQAPTVSWVAPSASGQSQDIDISYNAVENISNSVMALVVGHDNIVSRIPLPVLGSNPFGNYTLDGSYVTSGGVYYYIEITDGVNVTRSPTVDVAVQVMDSLVLPQPLDSGFYQMISVPLSHSDASVQTLFEDDWGVFNKERWRLFAYQNNSFIEMQSQSEVLPGQSYFLRTSGFVPTVGVSPGSANTLPISSHFTVSLGATWNTFSNPFLAPALVSQVKVTNPGLEYFYRYESGMWEVLADTNKLEPWKGYVIWNGASAPIAAQLFIPSGISAVNSEPNGLLKAKPIGKGQIIKIRAYNSTHSDGVLEFGISQSRAGLYPKPPKMESNLEFFFIDGEKSYLADIRKEIGEGKVWNLALNQSTNESVKLVFDGLNSLGTELKAVLISLQNREVLPISNSELVVEGGTQQFKLVVGSDGFIQSQVPKILEEALSLRLFQNVPNPFSGATFIKVSIPSLSPEENTVRLEIFNVKGRRVKLLWQGKPTPGEYQIQWDGKDDMGLPLPSGTYVYKLNLGSQRQLQKKSVLIR